MSSFEYLISFKTVTLLSYWIYQELSFNSYTDIKLFDTFKKRADLSIISEIIENNLNSPALIQVLKDAAIDFNILYTT